MAYLMIRDEEFSDYIMSLGSINDALSEKLSRIEECLEGVYKNGITSGDFHSNLCAFTEKLHGIDGQLDYLYSTTKGLSEEYITKIDEIDGTLY